jgi:hypothetical protein
MPRWLLPWLVPVGLVVVVIGVAASTLIGAVPAALIGAALALAVGLVGVPFIYRAYQDNRAGRGDGGSKPRRADPPNNRSLLR